MDYKKIYYYIIMTSKQKELKKTEQTYNYKEVEILVNELQKVSYDLRDELFESKTLNSHLNDKLEYITNEYNNVVDENEKISLKLNDVKPLKIECFNKEYLTITENDIKENKQKKYGKDFEEFKKSLKRKK